MFLDVNPNTDKKIKFYFSYEMDMENLRTFISFVKSAVIDVAIEGFNKGCI